MNKITNGFFDQLVLAVNLAFCVGVILVAILFLFVGCILGFVEEIGID